MATGRMRQQPLPSHHPAIHCRLGLRAHGQADGHGARRVPAGQRGRRRAADRARRQLLRRDGKPPYPYP
eukprot:scaffold65576_cov51-Phaeocystis_antarctica.AAC.1